MEQIRRPRRARRRAMSEAAPADLGLHAGPTPPYAPLPVATAHQLIDAALSLMQTVGVAFDPDSEAPRLLRAAGCGVSADGTARFEPALVRRALDLTRKSTRLWDREAERHLDLDDRHTWFLPGMTCIKVYDEASGEPRPSTAEDLARVTRVADSLPNIDAVCIACKDVSGSDPRSEIDEFSIMAQNTRKPLEYLCEDAASLAAVIDMAAAIRGGREALEEKPYFLQIITPLPLNYHRPHIEQILLSVRAGVPVSVGTLPIGGASTPITTAGSIVNSLATDFAAMVLAQVARPGSFCIGSSDVCFMEPATGGIGNFAQTSLADMVMCQVRRVLGLPSFTGAVGYSSARRFNADAVAEITLGLMQAFYTRPATLDYLGSVDQGLTFSLHALLLCDDVADLLRALWRGISVDAESLALDVAGEVGPRGNYLAHLHTVSHCRERLWQSRYFGPNLPLSTDGRADRELLERIEEDLRRRLEHRPAALAPQILERMQDIRARVGAASSR